jgi:flagellar biosynthesis protein FlhG
MIDQAEQLRQMARQFLPTARFVAVTSGKGGVGKTNVAVNLAVAAAALGKRVCLIDLDLGLANVDIILDINSRHNITSVVNGARQLRDVLVPGPGGIKVLVGASGIESLANLSDDRQASLIEDFKYLEREFDYVFLDTAAGISKNVVSFLACADQVMVVTTPEPTAMIDAYAVIKMVAAESGARVRRNPDASIGLVVNMAAGLAEAEKVAGGMAAIARRFLNVHVEKLGYVPMDHHVQLAVRRRRPFLLESPGCQAAQGIKALARRFCLGGSPEDGPRRQGFMEKLLGIFRAAPRDDRDVLGLCRNA